MLTVDKRTAAPRIHRACSTGARESARPSAQAWPLVGTMSCGQAENTSSASTPRAARQRNPASRPAERSRSCRRMPAAHFRTGSAGSAWTRSRARPRPARRAGCRCSCRAAPRNRAARSGSDRRRPAACRARRRRCPRPGVRRAAGGWSRTCRRAPGSRPHVQPQGSIDIHSAASRPRTPTRRRPAARTCSPLAALPALTRTATPGGPRSAAERCESGYLHRVLHQRPAQRPRLDARAVLRPRLRLHHHAADRASWPRATTCEALARVVVMFC